MQAGRHTDLFTDIQDSGSLQSDRQVLAQYSAAREVGEWRKAGRRDEKGREERTEEIGEVEG